MEVITFDDGPTRCEVWKLPDGGWDDWAATVDRFLAHAIRGIAAEYAGGTVEWLELNQWPISGRLIVFPSQDGPGGDRGERVSFELASDHLEAASERIGDTVPEPKQEAAWEALARRVWRRIGECLRDGDAAVELAAARRSFRLRVAGYDYDPGEGPPRLTESGAYLA
jgi:hypothetical protein